MRGIFVVVAFALTAVEIHDISADRARSDVFARNTYEIGMKSSLMLLSGQFAAQRVTEAQRLQTEAQSARVGGAKRRALLLCAEILVARAEGFLRMPSDWRQVYAGGEAVRVTEEVVNEYPGRFGRRVGVAFSAVRDSLLREGVVVDAASEDTLANSRSYDDIDILIRLTEKLRDSD